MKKKKNQYSKHFHDYMDLTLELIQVRKEEPEREDEILDAMDRPWMLMSDEERKYIDEWCKVVIENDFQADDGYIQDNS